MGGMKSGTGDVWGGDDDEDGDATREAEAERQSTDAEAPPSGSKSDGSGRDDSGVEASGASSTEAPSEGASSSAGSSSGDDGGANDIADGGSSSVAGAGGGDGQQPYVVRRMLKDKSVQFERDERLTLFVHDDVKAGEQDLEAEAQALFGRDIPVFDIREAVYRAALRNRDDVVEELETMGYTRED